MERQTFSEQDSPSMPVGPEKKSGGLSNTLWKALAGPLLVFLVAVVISRLNDRVSFKQDALTPSVFTVKAGSLSYFAFNVYKAGHVLGRFQAMGRNGDDAEAAVAIEAVITDAGDFENWKNGRPARVLYQSEKISTGSIDIPLRPGQYYLAFNNRFSRLTDKTIAASILLNQ
jgi:hypothetical protein